jgi:hypothetical protein
MSHATSWERAAEQLRTAAADVSTIAAQRETTTGPSRPASQDQTTQRDLSAPASKSTCDRMPTLPPAGNGCGLDTSVPNPARIYAYWLGGKDHFPADRIAAKMVMRERPQVVASARANRAFLARVVRYLAADCGIRQFLDVGAGLPALINTHEVAQQVDPRCRVAYADNDPLVLSHARALLRSTTREGACGYVDADLHEPDTVLVQAAQTLDFTQPVAILLLAVLHFIADSARPAQIVATLASALAPGSYLAISHLTADFAPGQVAAAAQAYNALAPVPVVARTHTEVTALFGGLRLLAPGVVPVAEWRPPIGQLPEAADLHAGLARIPRLAGPGRGRAPFHPRPAAPGAAG